MHARTHKPLLASQSVVRTQNIKICKTLTRPAATNAAESWAVNTDIVIWLAAFERKVLKKNVW
jgi:hypothetical protein